MAVTRRRNPTSTGFRHQKEATEAERGTEHESHRIGPQERAHAENAITRRDGQGHDHRERHGPPGQRREVLEARPESWRYLQHRSDKGSDPGGGAGGERTQAQNARFWPVVRHHDRSSRSYTPRSLSLKQTKTRRWTGVGCCRQDLTVATAIPAACSMGYP